MGLDHDLDVDLNGGVGHQLDLNITLDRLLLNRLDLSCQELFWLNRLHLTARNGQAELHRTGPTMPS